MKKISLILTTLIISLTLSAQATWHLTKNKNGIKVYTQSVPGYVIKKCKTQTTINAPVQKVFFIIRDVKNSSRWVEEVALSKEIETGTDYYVCYEVVKIGYGIKDRDIVTYEKIYNYPDGSIKITIKSAPNKYPRQKGKVRIEKVEGYWLLQPIDKNKTLLTYEFFSDPKKLPQWLINTFISESPYKTVFHLKQLAEK